MARNMETVGDRQYTMVSSETWIDVKDLTVEIIKTKHGIEVRVLPRNSDDGVEPLGLIRADFLEVSKRNQNVIPFLPRLKSYDPEK